MRQMISGLVAAIAAVTVSAVPAMACGGGLFGSSCSPCGEAYIPCAQYVAPVYSGCNTGCGGWAHEQLPDPEYQYGYASAPSSQYYYVNQGPTYTGPGNWAPSPTYQEAAVSGDYGYRRPYYHAPRHSYRYGYAHRSYRYGYGHRSYRSRYSGAPYYYGHRLLRRYY
jgi:hypothetical protein